ncbi:hypothetical protein FDP41_002394 [Naegleria fowleri]|uniref:EF-hand domain-containing protein n=1 Tax=Naegleria fowleri TaxID=5763 RepID=A0A6A5BWA6_NAEFO|nr:uncharacterized protein FDP41_002394 [Naegleria fowleri]KAF0978574.1 hypothetical protein FDP41_002394 [Naegleria fowleri]CAG4717258.1 unnamed protein product [Naegleria fowleri]
MSRSASSFIRKELGHNQSGSTLQSTSNFERASSPILQYDEGGARKFQRPQSTSGIRNRSRIEAPLPPPSMEELRAASPIANRSSSPIANRSSSPIQYRAPSPVNRSDVPKQPRDNFNESTLSSSNRVDRNQAAKRPSSVTGSSRSSSPNTIDKKLNTISSRIDFDSPTAIREYSHTSFDAPRNLKRPSSVAGYSKKNSTTSSTISGIPPRESDCFHNTTYNTHFVVNTNPNRSVSPTSYSSTSLQSKSSLDRELINSYFSKHNSVNQSHAENEKHVPVHLRNVDYSQTNDVLEVVKNKIHSLSPNLSEAFRRIKQATGYTGNKVRAEDFKRALVKDFHLLEDISDDTPNFKAVKQFQTEQIKKLDEFIKMADPKGEGAFGYSDFIRAMEELDRKLGTNSTTAQRETRYCGSMIDEAMKRRREKTEQYIEKIMDPKKDRAPYGVAEDLVKNTDVSKSVYYTRMELLRNTFGVENDKIPIPLFRDALKRFDRYILDVDVDQIIENMGAKKKGYISLNEFMNNYGFETIKSKSFRSSYENVKGIQWPQTLEYNPTKEEIMSSMRENKNKKKVRGRINNTRTNILRGEEIRRNTPSSLSGRLSVSSDRSSSSMGRSVLSENSSVGRSSSPVSFLKTPDYLTAPGGARSIRLSE